MIRALAASFAQLTDAAILGVVAKSLAITLLILAAVGGTAVLFADVEEVGAAEHRRRAEAAGLVLGASVPIVENTLNTHALGGVLYDRYFLAFQLAGLVLLVAMIGAILLTLRHRKDIKRQDVLQQMWRDPAKAMRMTNPKPGQGL